jgi:hypothetical protein
LRGIALNDLAQAVFVNSLSALPKIKHLITEI